MNVKTFRSLKSYLLLLALIVLGSGVVHASDSEKNQVSKSIPLAEQKTESDFDIAKAQQQFNAISLNLSTKERSYDDYVDAVTQLESLKVKAKVCAEEAQHTLIQVDEQLDAQMAMQKQSDSGKANYQYLREKREAILERASDCHLFVLRADEAIPVYKQSIQAMGRSQIFARATPVWGFGPELLVGLQDAAQKGTEVVRAHMNQMVPWLIGLALIFAFALVGGIMLSKKCSRQLSNVSKKNQFTYSFVATLGHSPLSISVIILAVFALGLSLALGMSPYLKDAGAVLLLLAVYAVFLKMIFLPTRGEGIFIQVDSGLGHVLFRRGIIQALVLTLGVIGINIANTVDIFLQVHDFVHMLCMLAVVSTSAWFAWGLIGLKAVQNRPFLPIVLKSGLLLLVLILGFLEAIGYQVLVVYTMNSLFATAVTLVFFTMIFYAWSKVLPCLLDLHVMTAEPIRYYLGVKAGKVFWEGVLLILLGYALLLFALGLTLLLSWQLPNFAIFGLINGAVHGFAPAGISIVPFKLFISILLFAVFNIVGRTVSAHVLHQVQENNEMRTQTALGSIIRYVAFVIALFLSFFIVDFDFTGIAWIVSALMVGIGLGLKDVVNNFISGIILLIEKPIAQGDRITVNGTQGYVKKIGLRSTCIVTDERADAIVPNSDIISHPVKNYKFVDRQWVVNCEIGVAHGSNLVQVKELLLAIAKQQSGVLQDSPNIPKVSFLSFNEDSLLFELRCIIHDIGNRKSIVSYLNFAIEKTFREQGIDISFAKQD